MIQPLLKDLKPVCASCVQSGVVKKIYKFLNNSIEVSKLKCDEFLPEIAQKAKLIPLYHKGNEISVLDFNPQKSDKYLLFFHGNAANVSTYQELYTAFADKNVGVLALEYSGYGLNPAQKFDEARLLEDAEGAYNYLIKDKKINPKNIVVVGHSLGGNVATNFVSRHNEINSLILAAPLVSAQYIGEKIYINRKIGIGVNEKLIDIFLDPVRKIYSNVSLLNTLSKLNKVKTPIYYLQTKDDIFTTYEGANVFVSKAKDMGLINQYKVFEKGGHKYNKQMIDKTLEYVEEIFNK